MTTTVFAFLGLLALAIIASLVSLPVSLQANLVAGFATVALMAVLHAVRSEGVWRIVTLTLGVTVVLRYVVWRTATTLPSAESLADFIPGLILYLAEMAGILMLGVTLFVIAKPLPPRPAPPLPDDLPTVDVLVPSYNEDADLLATTLAAAKAMDYPADRFTVWLLDDGGTRQKRESDRFEEAAAARRRHADLQALCADLGVRYLTRDRNLDAKAGNINHALGHCNGDLVVVFDADHAPTRDFLQQTVGHFAEDDRLFLVQSPHFFVNPDPVERNLGTFQRMPAENEMFYGLIQRGLDKWNGSFFCGSAAVLRRSALDQVGGIQTDSITEDSETALRLHALGWTSLYVDRPMVAGLQPATFASFVGQRTRWAQGMIQILIFHTPFLKAGLSTPQRIAYASSILFWMFPLWRMVFLMAPLCYIFLDLQIFNASGSEFVSYTVPYILANMMLQNYIYGAYRRPWISELYEYVLSVYLLPAVISVLVSPRKPAFKVTAKNEEVTEPHLSPLAKPFFLIFALMALGLVMTAVRYATDPFRADMTLMVGGWNLFNLLLAGCALGAVSERPDDRWQTLPVRRRCDLVQGDRVWPAVVDAVTGTGLQARVEGDHRELAPGSLATLRLPTRDDGPVLEAVVTVKAGERVLHGPVSLGFVGGPAERGRMTADLVYGDSTRWVETLRARRSGMGLIAGTLTFLMLSAKQTARGLYYLVRHARPKALKNAPAGQEATR